MNWQPIETAPKDGRVMLFWPIGIYGHSHIEFGRWDKDQYAKKPRPYWSGERPNSTTPYRQNPPTHWMPLPEPPK